MNPLLITSLVFFAVFTYFFFKFSDNERDRAKEAEDAAVAYSRTPTKVFIQAFLLMMILLSAYTAARVSLDEADHCDWLKANETVSENVTSYEYSYECDNAGDAPIYQNYLKAVVFTMIAVGIYVLFNLLRSMYELARKWLKYIMERK